MEPHSLKIPFQIKKKGNQTLFFGPNREKDFYMPRIDPTLIKSLVKAWEWRNLIEEGEITSFAELAEREGYSDAGVADRPCAYKENRQDTDEQGDDRDAHQQLTDRESTCTMSFHGMRSFSAAHCTPRWRSRSTRRRSKQVEPPGAKQKRWPLAGDVLARGETNSCHAQVSGRPERYDGRDLPEMSMTHAQIHMAHPAATLSISCC